MNLIISARYYVYRNLLTYLLICSFTRCNTEKMAMVVNDVDPEAIAKIIDHKTENGEDLYKVQWKESWVPRKHLKGCFAHIESFFIEEKSTNSKGQVVDTCDSIVCNGQPKEEKIEESIPVGEVEQNGIEENEINSKLIPDLESVDIVDDIEVGIQEIESTEKSEQKAVIVAEEKQEDVNHANKENLKDEQPSNGSGRIAVEIWDHLQNSLQGKSPESTILQLIGFFVLKKTINFNLQVPQRQSWYTDDKVKKQLLKFYEENAKTPQQLLSKAKQQHTIYMKQLEMELTNIGWCKKLEYTGSSYEGLKISKDIMEFDVMFIMEGKDLELVPISGREGYSNLHLLESQSSVYTKFTDKNGVLSPKKMIAKFLGIVQSILNKLNLKDTIKLKTHGPAVQMDVKNDKGNMWYSVDLVPAIEIAESGDRYVPKPLNEPDTGDTLINSWRRSFSKEEKDILKSLDDGNGCRRQVVRILKALCKKESTLQELNSYHLKTILFHMIGPNGLDLSWTVANVTERVLDMLGVIEYFLTQRFLPQYFIPSMNLIGNIEPNQMANVLNRIKVLRTKENKFIKALSF